MNRHRTFWLIAILCFGSSHLTACSSDESSPAPSSEPSGDAGGDSDSDAAQANDSAHDAPPPDDATPDTSSEDGANDASSTDDANDGPVDAPADVLSDIGPDSMADGQPDVADDAPVLDALPDVVDAAEGGGPEAGQDAGPEAGPGNAVTRLGAAEDALASYLMSAAPAAWNIFHGATVPLGRHFDVGNVSYHTALRFAAVSVPPGAQIDSATLTFSPTNEVDSSNNLWINIYAEKSSDSAPFDPSNYISGRPDQRLKTNAFIDHWLVRCNAACTDDTEYDCPQRKLDCWNRNIPVTVPKNLKAMIQEVVAQPGWASGNAITLLLINSATDQDGVKYRDHRSITGFDPSRGPEYSPSLSIEYTVP